MSNSIINNNSNWSTPMRRVHRRIFASSITYLLYMDSRGEVKLICYINKNKKKNRNNGPWEKIHTFKIERNTDPKVSIRTGLNQIYDASVCVCVCVCKYMYRITFNVRVKRTCSPRSRSMNRVHAYKYGSVGCKYLFRRTLRKVKTVSSIPHTTVVFILYTY